MKRILAVLLVLIMAFAMTACGSDSNTDAQTAMISVEVEIDFPDDSGINDIEDAVVQIPEGGTVLDALSAYGEANDCEIVMEETANPPYVVGIGGHQATDTAGWVYEVNDEMVMESADACVVNDGDEISWSFESWM